MNITPNGVIASTNGAIPAVSPYVRPQHLPAKLDPLFDYIADLARWKGYCFARTSKIAERLGCSHVHAWRLLNKLVAFGRLRIEKVPGSHERRLYPVFLRRSVKRTGNENVSKSDRSFIRTEPSTKETAEQAAPAEPVPVPLPDSPAVVALVEEKISRPVARTLVGAFGEARVLRVLAWARSRREKARSVPALIVAALRGGWEVDAAGEGGEASERQREVDRPRNYVRAPREDEARECPRIAPDCPHSAPGASGDRFAGMTPRERLAVMLAEKNAAAGKGAGI